MSESLILSPKYKDFLKYKAPVEFLEGTTAAGKTTVGIVKFMFKVADSAKKIHIISGLDTGTIEKNIINKDLGILDVFGELVEYNPSGKGEYSMPHLIYRTPNGDKVVYILGYDNKARWKKALGGQYGCLYIDEINIADMEYIREASMRCDYLMATLNPDDPSLPVYEEYINHARPTDRYANDAPPDLLNMLNAEPKSGWVWWYFSFDHNAGLPQAKKEQIISMVPPGTKLYKNKILGLRGRATGLVFSNFDRSRHIVNRNQLLQAEFDKKIRFVQFSAGLDTAYSSKSPDTISMIFQGITQDRKLIVLDERVYNNANMSNPIAPSDTVRNFIDFLERNREVWGFARQVYIDSADQATITELKKYKRQNPCLYNFNGAWKKTKIIDRINMQLGWLHTGDYLVCDTCRVHISELEAYSWAQDKDNEPEDRNDHTINASQYGFLPYVKMIGEIKQ
jgi:PBSX family phage terminase large subunit|nr:MAG TPA: large terminase [Caudoviricetes sp.]